MKITDEINPDGKELTVVSIEFPDALLELAGDYSLAYSDKMLEMEEEGYERCDFHKEMDIFIVRLLCLVGINAPSYLEQSDINVRFSEIVDGFAS